MKLLCPDQLNPGGGGSRGGGGGGGGVLGLEKGTDCGPSAAELWLSRANNAKKGGLSSHYEWL